VGLECRERQNKTEKRLDWGGKKNIVPKKKRKDPGKITNKGGNP